MSTLQQRGRRRTAAPGRSKGVVLIIALILLAVIGISSALALRMSLFGDIVSQNLRAQNLALQAAELALRYCERQVATDPGSVAMLRGPGAAVEWQLADNWTPARSVAVPAGVLGTAAGYNTPPQCLVRAFSADEYLPAETPGAGSISSDDRGFSSEFVVLHRITARGFSPDFARDNGGQPISGAEIWLQSVVRGVQ